MLRRLANDDGGPFCRRIRRCWIGATPSKTYPHGGRVLFRDLCRVYSQEVCPIEYTDEAPIDQSLFFTAIPLRHQFQSSPNISLDEDEESKTMLICSLLQPKESGYRLAARETTPAPFKMHTLRMSML